MSDSNLTNNDIKFIASKLKFKTSNTVKFLGILFICILIISIYVIVLLVDMCNDSDKKLKEIEKKNIETFKNFNDEIRYLQSRSDKQDSGNTLFATIPMPMFENKYENKNLEFALSGL